MVVERWRDGSLGICIHHNDVVVRHQWGPKDGHLVERATAHSLGIFTSPTLEEGLTYGVAAECEDDGYIDWSFHAGDD